MLLDDLSTARRISQPLLFFSIQLVIIVIFGGGWTSWNTSINPYNLGKINAPYSTLVPYPNGIWWANFTAILIYITFAISFIYIIWFGLQLIFPQRIPFDPKMLTLIDMLFSGILTIFLVFAYSFFAGGLSSTTAVSTGYCFWFAVLASITSAMSTIIAGVGWFRN